MPTFEYIAKDAAGAAQNGVIQAESEAAVIRALNQRRLYPVRVTPQAAQIKSPFRSGKVGLRQLGAAYGQLADLLSAGVPMLRALDIVVRAGAHAGLKRVLREVREDVSAGETLADAMGRHPEVFTRLHMAMIRAGEHAGFLEDVLNNLATFMERQDELRGKVRGAMIYPMVLAVFGVTVVSIILVFLVPQFSKFLANMPLPLPSRMLFALSALMREHAVFMLVGLFLAGFMTRTYIHSERGKKLWAIWQLKLPVVGRAIRMVAITRFCRVFGTLLANGVPIIQALGISKDATGNDMMAAAIEKAADNVRAGEPLADPLDKSGLFPPEIIEMIVVGEESNQLEKVLLQVADTVERRTNRQVDAAVRLVEPLLLLVMALAIGFVAIGLLYPIITMAQAMR